MHGVRDNQGDPSVKPELDDKQLHAITVAAFVTMISLVGLCIASVFWLHQMAAATWTVLTGAIGGSGLILGTVALFAPQTAGRVVCMVAQILRRLLIPS